MPNLEDWIPNRKAKPIFAEIRRRGVVSKFDLLEMSGLTSSTLTRMLEELATSGWIEESGLGESSGGRRPLLYRLKHDRGYVLGLDVSRASTRLVLCDLQLEKIDSASWQMTERMTPDRLLQEIEAAANKMIAKHGLDRGRLLGIGIGAVGPVDRTNGTMLNPLYFPAEGWSQVPIGPKLERMLGVPVLLDNGANTALLAEYWAGSQQYRHLLYVRAGVGLRSAMMSNGQLVYGAVDMEGSVGHMIIQTDGPPHPERPHVFGCLESFVSIPVLEKQAAAKLKQGRRSVLTDWVDRPDDVGFHHLLKALSADDRLVTELFTQAATYFGIGLSNLLNILHPEKVILGGPLITSNELFYQISTQVALKNTLYYPTYPVTFSRGKLSDDALAVGAAAMVVDRLTS
ncbi:ROK family protein [Paenibacillus flagellatus]|uniref:Sugar kinase n=1 Tax=Paenibacillus flagellatus TaxID=2211139 RepID=A0A2V5K7J7_9BACL|nr:ROK family protein [Paenibacillus flagellatus]PYI55409.1 sugar kinase [Paenibacillus flagellatus]